MAAEDVVSFHRSNDFPHVGAECRGVRDGVGVTEIANFAKYTVEGAGAEVFLARLMTNRLPSLGRLVLTPMLNHAGKLIGDFTITRTAAQRFVIWGSSQAQKYHMRWFEAQLPADGSVAITRHDMGLVGLSIAGPKSRDLLQCLTDEDVSKTGFRFRSTARWMSPTSRPWSTASPIPAISVMKSGGARISAPALSGDRRGRRGVRPRPFRHAGAALPAVEKNFPTWYRELRPIYGPFEAGLDRFVDLTKPDFIGRDAALEEQRTGGTLRRISLAVDAADADVLGDEPIWHGGKVVGWVTSGGYGHCVGTSLAQGYVPKDLAADLTAGTFSIEILGDRRAATVLPEPLFDPTGARMRM